MTKIEKCNLKVINLYGASIKKMKNIFQFIKRKAWYLFLLIASTIYVIDNYQNIGSLKQLDVSAILFVVWIALLLLPLFSSIQIGTIKLSKQLDDIQRETKDAINDMKLQMMEIKVSTANSIIVNSYLPSDKTMNNLKDSVQENCDKEAAENIREIEVDEELMFLFKARFKIEELVSQLCNNYDYQGNRLMTSMTQFLCRQEAINNNQSSTIQSITNICNRAMHGESIAPKYVEFVRDMMPAIINQLEREIKRRTFSHECTRCGYRGPSRYENYCPNCGNVTCD